MRSILVCVSASSVGGANHDGLSNTEVEGNKHAFYLWRGKKNKTWLLPGVEEKENFYLWREKTEFLSVMGRDQSFYMWRGGKRSFYM